MPAVAALRQEDFDVIAFDAPAHGHSSGRKLPFDQYARAIGAVVDHYPGITALIAALVIWRHKDNIKRLMAGTEPKIGQKREEKEQE